MRILEGNNFYKVDKDYDDLATGRHLRVEHYVEIDPALSTEISSLAMKSEQELKMLEAESEKIEESIFQKLIGATAEWEEQAAHTKLIEAALAYVRTRAPEHTSNQWVKTKYGYFEISNLVYKFQYDISMKNARSNQRGASAAVFWTVSWSLRYNMPLGNTLFYSLEDMTIAIYQNKNFDDQAEAERYVQTCFSRYAHLFTEISPPIPESGKRLFCMSGLLLPGYTIAPHEPTPDELLEFVDGLDLDEESGVNIEPHETVPERATKKSGAKKKSGKSR